ncbi:hypothetical protein E9993_15990 [Labilibacter sediminis]|nr:hypothetical protein E9993_15990 [Labilibacter sediminis]
MLVSDIIRQCGTPVYVYEENRISQNYQEIVNAFPYQNKQVHYAVMCNNNMEVLKILRNLGSSVQINSLLELELVKKAGFKKEQISFTSTGMNTESLQTIVKEEIQVNLDSVEEVEKYCRLSGGRSFGIRINIKEDIELEEGHTNSYKSSDVGICEDDFTEVKKVAKKWGSRINGIHGYLASNLLETAPFIRFSNYMAVCAKHFDDLEYVNFGSGFGVFCESLDRKFDFDLIGNHYSNIMQELSSYFDKNIQLKIEPGRSVVASAGILLTRVTNVKQLKNKKQLSIDVGFGDFARPKLYDACHSIEVVGKNGANEVYDVRGNTVLQSDFLGRNRALPIVEENDILVIRNTGGYGSVMASGFPGKRKPMEILVQSFPELR